MTMTRRRRMLPSVQHQQWFLAVALLLLQQLLCSTTTTTRTAVLAFAPLVVSPMTRSHKMGSCFLEPWKGRHLRMGQEQLQQQQQRWMQLSLKAATTSTTESTEEEILAAELYETATQLLGLVLEKRNRDIEPLWKALFRKIASKEQDVENEQSAAIEALIEALTFGVWKNPTKKTPQTAGISPLLNRLLPTPSQATTPSCYYDPAECLFGGGFFATLYFYYPNSSDGNKPEDPIWEQTSLKSSNIKGQQYYIRNDFSQSVINYSEVWGPSISIGAEGVLTPIEVDEADFKSSSTSGKQNPKPKTKPDSRSLRKLPDVFKVDATKLTASIFGRTLDFNIQGSANLVVLYADPRIRIFVSPLASETVVGNWEEAGLVVVQVRGDLVPPENDSISQVLDLR